MADRVRMKSRTVFANERITVFSNGAPEEGVRGGAVQSGEEFETDLLHAQELDRLGRAEPLNRADLDGEAKLEPSHQVSVAQMRAQDPNWQPTTAPGYTGPVTAPIAQPLATVPAAGDDGLTEHTVAELQDIAKAESIDLGDARKKDDIVSAIRGARGGSQG